MELPASTPSLQDRLKNDAALSHTITCANVVPNAYVMPLGFQICPPTPTMHAKPQEIKSAPPQGTQIKS